MSLGFNSIQLLGNLGSDPELRAVNGGLSVCEFSLAVNERVGRADDQKEVVTWVRVVSWNGVAETAAAYLAKGRRVFVSGALRVEHFDGRDGVPRTVVKVMARTIKFLDAPLEAVPVSAGVTRPGAEGQPQRAARAKEDAPPAGVDAGADDVPF